MDTKTSPVKDLGVSNAERKDAPAPAAGDVPFEEALDMTGFGRYNYTLLATSTLLLLSAALEMFGTGYVVTGGGCDLRLTTATRGLVSAMPMLGIVLSSHLWGWLADTRGRRPVLLASMWGTLLVAAVGSFARNWVEMAVCKLISSFFAAAANAVTYALYSESTPGAARARTLLLLTSGLMCAQGVMSLIAYPILSLDFNVSLAASLNYRPWRLLQQAYAAPAAVTLLLLQTVHESPKFHASRGNQEESLRILGEIYATNSGKSAKEFAVSSVRLPESELAGKPRGALRALWQQTAPMFQRPYLKDTLVLLYVVIMVYSIAPPFLMWTPEVTNALSRGGSGSLCDAIAYVNTTHSDVQPEPACIDRIENTTYIALLVFGLYMCAFNALNAWLVRACGKRALVAALHVLGGGAGLALPVINNKIASLVLFFMFQTNIVAMGLTTGFTVEIYPTQVRAMAVCLTMMVGRAVSFAVVSQVGELMRAHCQETFYGFGLAALSGGLAAMLLPRDPRPVTVTRDP